MVEKPRHFVPLGLGVYPDGSNDPFDYVYTDLPRTIIALDRNFIYNEYGNQAKKSTDPCVELRSDTTGWRDDVHGVVGNVAFADGSVDTLTTTQFQQAVYKVRPGPGRYVRVHYADWGQ